MASMDALVEITESLRGVHLRRCSPKEVDEKLSTLIVDYQPMGVTRSEAQIWFRARPCPSRDGYDNLRRCIYPPDPAKVGYGRANLPGAPAMYSAWNEHTALDEISAESGQLVQIIYLRPKPGVQFLCHVIGDYAHVHNSGRSQINSEIIVNAVWGELDTLPPELQDKHRFVDTFLAEQFSRPHGRAFEFKLTAAFAARLYRGKGGVIYPSVERRGGMNLATSAQDFDRSFEVVHTSLVEIKRFHGCGVYECKLIKTSSTFAADGTIDWKASQDLNFSRSPAGGLQLPGYTGGWSVPPAS